MTYGGLRDASGAAPCPKEIMPYQIRNQVRILTHSITNSGGMTVGSNARNERIKRHQWSYLTKYLRNNEITYSEYLQTEHWKDVKKRFWSSKLHHGECQVCGAKTNLQVHHKTYKRIGKEHLNDLCLLCGNCHTKTHELDKRRTKGILWGAAKRLRKNLRNKQRIASLKANTTQSTTEQTSM